MAQNQSYNTPNGLQVYPIQSLPDGRVRYSDGSVGWPQSKASNTNTPQNVQSNQGATSSQPTGPQNQAELEQLYTDAAPKNPAIAKLAEGGSSIEEIINALSTGNLTGIVDWQGQPFSVQDQQDALTNAGLANKDYYNALQEKDKADAEAKLASDKANYQDYLINAGQAFESDKANLDQQSADKGVLFSGSRTQKQKNLERNYTQDQASKTAQYGNSIGQAANDFQYKYGSDAASGLNKYYNLGGNTFNASTARGGVGSSGISNVYSPSKYSYQGTVNTERKADTATRAAGYLWNKGNKLLATGYQNQYK